MPPVSVTVITRNAARHIEQTLRSVDWAAERIVVDCGSTDDTVALARPLATLVAVRAWDGYGAQKNHAASLAAHDWILSLDADEVVSDPLRDAIAGLGADPSAAACRMPRVTWYLGRWIRSTDWYPDRSTRLYDRRRARWDDRPVHEALVVDGEVGDLHGEIEHRPYADVADHLARINHYTTLAAAQMDAERRGVRAWHLPVQPIAAFLRNYLARGGYRDGVPGLVVSLLGGVYVLLKYVKLWERRHSGRHAP
ncbi:MAG: glycosyltransferase family 2 protein [Luteitalea sp.]|nr:glycosyltransferase family 2 protein [Acidobacteriota bacterium]